MSIPYPKPATDPVVTPPSPPTSAEEQMPTQPAEPEAGKPGKDENAAGLLKQADLAGPHGLLLPAMR